MNEAHACGLVAVIRALVEAHDDLRVLAACGSWVRGNPRPDSDPDLLIIADDPIEWRREQSWVATLPFGQAELAYLGHADATYGIAWSAHVSLVPDAKLELTFAPPLWASLDPLDPGTHRVVSDAFAVLVDKDGCFARLVGGSWGGRLRRCAAARTPASGRVGLTECSLALLSATSTAFTSRRSVLEPSSGDFISTACFSA